jgi:mRNA interferase MazF
VPLTSRLERARSPGNVLLLARLTGLPRDSVASIPQILAVDRSLLTERAGHLAERELRLVMDGIDIVLGR